MSITITLGDLGLFILFAIGVTVGVFLIIALVKLIGLLKRITDLVDANRQNIDRSLENLPEVLENANEATTLVKNGLYKTEDTIDALSDTFLGTAAAVENKTEAVLNYVVIASEIAKGVYEFFSKRDQK